MLTRKQQIRILTKAKEQLIIDHKYEKCMVRGLCGYLEKEIIAIYDKEFVSYYHLKQYIPLFTLENAEKWANAKPNEENYWWKHSNDPSDYDLKNRVLFLEWMIKELRWKFIKQLLRYVKFRNFN